MSIERCKKRFREYFEGLLNAGRDLDLDALCLEQPGQVDEEEPPPSMKKVENAIRKLKNHKAAGADGIYAEMIKEGGEIMVKRIHRLITKIWEEEKTPEV